MKIVAIAVALVGLISGITGNAPQAIPLEPGRVYQTGSPLSQPGPLGLLGGIVGMRQGGGFERWDGPHIDPLADVYNVTGGWSPATVHEYVGQSNTMTWEQAQAAIDAAAPIENKQRVIVPDCENGQLSFVFVPDPELGARMIYTCMEEK